MTNENDTNGANVSEDATRVTFTLPDPNYWARPVPRGQWHVFDRDEKRSLCGVYNTDGVHHGPMVDEVPNGVVCPDCRAEAPYLQPPRDTDSEDGGLRSKYTVLKDGEPQDGCFVLKPEDDPAARVALAAYADATENQELETDLKEWLSDIPADADPGLWTDGGEDVTDGVDADAYLTDGVDADAYLTDGVDADAYLTDGVDADAYLTDGVDADAYLAIPDKELERYQKRKAMFTCPDCGEVADARVESTEHLGQMLWKPWVELHTDTDGDGAMVYVHVDGDAIDRGADLRALAEKYEPEDVEVDPREPPEDDRPDLDGYHRAATRQGRDPHTGGPRTDGGGDWTEQYATTTYRGPQKYPVPGAWVLGIVEGDGIGWKHYGDAGEGLSHDTEVADAMDYDEYREGPDTYASLMSEYPEDADVLEDPPYHELKVDGDVVLVLKDASEVEESEWWRAIAEALARYDSGEDAGTVLTDLGLEHLKADPFGAREDTEDGEGGDADHSLDEFATDGGARVYDTERCDGAGDDECVHEDPELTRGEDAIHVTKYGPRHSETGRQVLCAECKDKQVALNIADDPDVAYLYRDVLAVLRERFPDILGSVDLPVTDGGEEQVPMPEWEVMARENVQKWGEQDPGALALAMIEEMGELCRNLLLASEYVEGGPTESRRRTEDGRDYIRRMADLGENTRDYLERVSEDGDGEPLHPEDRPDFLNYGRQRLWMRHTREELDDVMALGYQFLWAVEDTEYRGGGDE